MNAQTLHAQVTSSPVSKVKIFLYNKITQRDGQEFASIFQEVEIAVAA